MKWNLKNVHKSGNPGTLFHNFVSAVNFNTAIVLVQSKLNHDAFNLDLIGLNILGPVHFLFYSLKILRLVVHNTKQEQLSLIRCGACCTYCICTVVQAGTVDLAVVGLSCHESSETYHLNSTRLFGSRGRDQLRNHLIREPQSIQGALE